jgi:hypothetical protein
VKGAARPGKRPESELLGHSDFAVGSAPPGPTSDLRTDCFGSFWWFVSPPDLPPGPPDDLGSGDNRIIAPVRRRRGLCEILLVKAVEAGPTAEDFAADIGGDAGVGQHPGGHVGEA